ncbi:hypothetical protein [Deinococcus sp. NW-56]|uniref:hypothetical protein n=1 Tax=Deinococcus sp. NW-56 TaxID=2080419 RepID=UPI000CF52C64|nr:hypothetical protein [Deinococcus sp. NW-56]
MTLSAPPLSPPPEPARLRVLGTAAVLRGNTALPLSRKGTLLLTYLALEGRPVHRSTVAELLWPGGRGLASLRVELSKLRAQGLDVAPGGGPLLRFTAETDLGQLAAEAGAATFPTPALEGPPLGGLDDPGNPALQTWLDTQRQRLDGTRQAVRRQRAAAPGDSPQERLEGSAVAWLAGRFAPELRAAQELARREPQVLLYTARSGHGTRAALRSVLEGQDWPFVELDAVHDPRLLLTSLLLRLRTVLPAEAHGRLAALLEEGPPVPRLVSGLSALLIGQGQPLVIVLHRAGAGAGPGDLLPFALNWPLPLVVLLVTTPCREEALARAVRQRFGGGRLRVFRASPLPSAALPDPAHALPLIRHSEGWLTALRPLFRLRGPWPARVRLTPAVRDDLLAEVEQALPGSARALAPLAALPSPFPPEQALAHLPLPGAEGRALLEAALRLGLLERVPPVLHADLPELRGRLPDGEHPLGFGSELTRCALAATLEGAARAALREQPRQGWAAGVPAPRLPTGPQPAGTAPPTRGEFRRTVVFPGGYRAEQWDGQLTLLRLGAEGHAAPELCLTLPLPHGTRTWRLAYRLDEFRPDRAGALLTAECGGEEHVLNLGDGPDRRWRLWCGPAERHGASLVLRVRALDLTLHLAVVGREPGMS